ncbi:MAG: iron ABC transporter permease [Thermomicrobiales bacterium]|nr:iron ABC transporter permease [Thermomicrobiales bacterium]MCO5223098.1 iron ABC transporter permease [Thermomicrobiales bacterium]
MGAPAHLALPALTASSAVALALAVLLVTVIAAVSIGPVSLPFGEVWSIVATHVSALVRGDAMPTGGANTIVWEIRLPRALLGVVVGSGLAVVGVVIQALLGNPLADPYIIGVSSGASLGAILVIVLGGSALGVGSIPTGAFIGALLAFGLVFLIAYGDGGLAPMRLVLAGVAVAALLGSFASFIVISAKDHQVRGALYWSMGGLTGATWSDLRVPAVVVIVLTGYFLLQGRALNAIAFGDETAGTLGIDVPRFRLVSIVLAALMTGVVVAVSGGIGFVALVIPHMVRLLVGGDHRKVLPLSAWLGAVFLVWVDVFARMVVQPVEVPIGVITSAIGAPIFLLLLRTRALRTGARA